MKRIIAIVMVSILVILNVNTAIPVSAAVDNSKYIPKIVTENGKNHLVFDPEIAKIAREMSVDAYGVEKGSKAKDIAKTFDNEGFVDIQQSKSYWYDALTSSFSNNFLVGVKTFEIDGSKKHVLAIAFRGTNDAIDIVTDLTYKDSNGYHDGFYAAAIEAYDSLYDMKFDSIKNEKGKSISFIEFLHQSILTDDYYVLVTGHSLGGAVANIFTGEILPNCGVTNSAVCYTFASPNTCSTSKAKQKDAYNIFNIINTEDVVPVVGYGITKGARLGIDLKSTVSSASLSVVDVVRDNLKLSSGNIVYMLDTISTYKDIIFDNHDINKSYNKVTTQVISNIGSMYKYTIPYYIKWKNGGSDNTTGSNGGGFRGENNTQEPVTPQGTTTNNSEQIERNKIIQIRLNYVIGAGLEVDGICGQQTIEAIKKFQRAYGLTVDGICGSATWNKLEEVCNNPQSVPDNKDETNASTPITLDAPKRVGIDYSNTKTITIPININGTIPEGANLQGECNQSISATWEQVAGQNVVNAYVTANYKLKDIDGVLTAKIVDKTGNVLDSIQIVIHNTSSRFTIKFDANGGTNAPAEVIKCEGFYSEIPYLRPTREGYEFAGWSTSKYSGEVEYNCGDEIVESRNMILYAVWADKYAFSPLKLEFDKFISDTSSEKIIQYNFITDDWVEKATDLIQDVEIISGNNTDNDWWIERNDYGEICLNVLVKRTGKQKTDDVVIKIISNNDNYLFEENIIVDWQNNDFSDRNKNGITVYVDGEKLNFDVQPRVINSRTMVPMRAIFEALDADVYWNGDTQTVYGETYDTSIEITIGEAYLLKNSEYVELDSPAVIIDGRTLVPVRAIAEGLNCKVEWYGETQTVEITSSDNSYLPEQIIADGEYVIATKLNSNYVLDIVNAETDNCVNLQLWEKSITPAQYFTVTYLGNGYYRIVNTYSGKALDSEWGGTEPGTNVWQYEINDTPAQIWKIEPAEDNSYYIINKESGLYLDVENAWADCGTNVGLFVRNDAYDAQKWYFIEK